MTIEEIVIEGFAGEGEVDPNLRLRIMRVEKSISVERKIFRVVVVLIIISSVVKLFF